MSSIQSFQIFHGRKCILATMHEKEKVIAPLLEKFLGVEVIIPKNFDTDKFGTFTGEIKRAGNQFQTAKIKLESALAATNSDLGVSSEGSFDAHPEIPFIQSNLELVLLIDKKNNLEICGYYRSSDTNMSGQYVESADEALDFAKNVGFPKHGIIVRKNQNGNFGINKNIKTQNELVEIVKKMLTASFTKKVYIETDMRAHRNPTRMKVIKKATANLIKKLLSTCPQCHAPGFIVTEIEKGLKCIHCGLPTELPQNEIYRCNKCNFQEKKRVKKYGKNADPKFCSFCNP